MSAIHLQRYRKKIPFIWKLTIYPWKTVLHSKFMFHQWGDNYNYLHGIFTPFSAQTKGHVTRRSRLASPGNSAKQLHQGLSLSDTVLRHGCQCSLKHAVSALPWSIGFYLSISWILLGIKEALNNSYCLYLYNMTFSNIWDCHIKMESIEDTMKKTTQAPKIPNIIQMLEVLYWLTSRLTEKPAIL